MQKYDPETIKKNLRKWQVSQLLKESKRPPKPLTHQPFQSLKAALGGAR